METNIFERVFGKDFFSYLESETGYKFQKEGSDHFTCTVNETEVFDFSMVPKFNLLVIGYPFYVKSGYTKIQYRGYVSYAVSDTGRDVLIHAIWRRIKNYLEGGCDSIKGELKCN